MSTQTKIFGNVLLWFLLLFPINRIDPISNEPPIFSDLIASICKSYYWILTNWDFPLSTIAGIAENERFLLCLHTYAQSRNTSNSNYTVGLEGAILKIRKLLNDLWHSNYPPKSPHINLRLAATVCNWLRQRSVDFLEKTKNPTLHVTVSDLYVAEGEGFEPSMPYWTCRLSRAVQSTTLPSFRGLWINQIKFFFRSKSEERALCLLFLKYASIFVKK